jgi:hypothetical protein
MRIATSCNSQPKKTPPGRYCVRLPHREVMLVTRTPKVMLAPDLGFEMRSIDNDYWKPRFARLSMSTTHCLPPIVVQLCGRHAILRSPPATGVLE